MKFYLIVPLINVCLYTYVYIIYDIISNVIYTFLNIFNSYILEEIKFGKIFVFFEKEKEN